MVFNDFSRNMFVIVVVPLDSMYIAAGFSLSVGNWRNKLSTLISKLPTIHEIIHVHIVNFKF